MKVCLVVIFNHRYDKVLPKLRQIYHSRFKTIRFLMPFYDGDDTDVIPVFESSYSFQGYVAQAAKDLQQLDCDTYFFVADDMFLNPELNEFNLDTRLGVEKGKSYCESISQANLSMHWDKGRVMQSIHTFKPFYYQTYVNYESELMLPFDAFNKAKKYGYADWKLAKGYKYAGPPISRIIQYCNNILFLLRWLGHIYPRTITNLERAWKRRNEFPYPLFMGYSDWFILSKEDLMPVAHAFGVMSGMKVFVEIAIPTVMFLYCKKLGLAKELKLRGKAVWTNEEKRAIEDKNERNLANLEKNFPSGYMYLHPVKMSRWE